MAKKLTTAKLMTAINIAELLDADRLEDIGMLVVDNFKKDKDSRKAWEDRSEDAMKLALQVAENKNFPWEKASNVKYPLLTLASIQFASRVDLFTGPDIVKVRVNGYDPKGTKTDRALRIQKHMSYQLTEEMSDWEDGNDKLFHALPIVGAMFKKTYFDPILGRNCSYVIWPKHLVFDYWAKSVEECHRKTEILYLTPNKIEEKVRSGLYRDIDFPITQSPERDLGSLLDGQESYDDDNAPRELLEQHTYWDLDDDGYQEPYIITVDKESKQVLRIYARYDKDGIKRSKEKGNDEIIAIEPIEYFTQFTFIPNPDGGNLGLGFGHLLGPINESVNTLINQLIDAGTLSNLQSGFIGKGLRIKAGKLTFQPGEWKFVQSSGDDLKNNIFPMPIREPSNVLFTLLNLLVTAGERVGSVTDAMVGDNPPTNQPATTTLATMEQGLKVFKRIHKRLYGAFTKEFKKLFALNKKYLTPQAYFSVLDVIPDQQQKMLPQTNQVMQQEAQMVVTMDDYRAAKDDISPSADPNVMTEMERAKKIEALLATVQVFNWPMEVLKKRYIEMMNFPNPDELLQPVPPPPNPDMMKLQQEGQIEQAKMQLEQARMQMEAQVKQMEAQMKGAEMQFKEKELALENQKLQVEIQKTEMEIAKIEAEIRKILAEIEAMDGEAAGAQDQKALELEKLNVEREKLFTESEIKRKELELKDKEIVTGADTTKEVENIKAGGGAKQEAKHKELLTRMDEMHKSMTGPKKIIRDKNGLIAQIGDMKIQRDEKGQATGVAPNGEVQKQESGTSKEGNKRKTSSSKST